MTLKRPDKDSQRAENDKVKREKELELQHCSANELTRPSTTLLVQISSNMKK